MPGLSSLATDINDLCSQIQVTGQCPIMIKMIGFVRYLISLNQCLFFPEFIDSLFDVAFPYPLPSRWKGSLIKSRY